MVSSVAGLQRRSLNPSGPERRSLWTCFSDRRDVDPRLYIKKFINNKDQLRIL